MSQGERNSLVMLSLLGAVCLMLKLGGAVDWPWSVVTAPFWFAPVVVAFMLSIVGLVLGVLQIVEWWMIWRRKRASSRLARMVEAML
jgi:hypothetical protein